MRFDEKFESATGQHQNPPRKSKVSFIIWWCWIQKESLNCSNTHHFWDRSLKIKKVQFSKEFEHLFCQTRLRITKMKNNLNWILQMLIPKYLTTCCTIHPFYEIYLKKWGPMKSSRLPPLPPKKNFGGC